MLGWLPVEDEDLKQMYGKSSKAELESRFDRKYQAIWLRAKKLGLAKSQAKGKHRWSEKELDRLFTMTKGMADPKEIAKAFPGVAMDELIAEAEKIGCEINYLKNREVIRRSVDVIVDLDLTINFAKVSVR